MEYIRIKILPAVGDFHPAWELIPFDEFLMSHSPSLRYMMHGGLQFPPLHVLNEELMSGGEDQGMSGGCYWKPFELKNDSYEEIKEEMLTSPKYDLHYDEELETKPNLKKWCGAVMSKHNPRKRKQV